MKTRQADYRSLDVARLAAAFLIVAIHVGPFAGGGIFDAWITYGLTRVGVPYFFMLTGFFVLSGYGRKNFREKLFAMLRKLLLLYLAATMLYLPFSWRAGNLPTESFLKGNIIGGIGAVLRWILMDGTFYHLWYLPAAVIGCLLVSGGFYLLNKAECRHPLKVLLGIAAALYVVGVFGDSWYGLISGLPVLKKCYDAVFTVGGYTRNGIFFAPVFLLLGVFLAKYKISRSKRFVWTACAVSAGLLTPESLFTWAMGYQKHNSMYFLLLPCMLFLFEGLLQTKMKGEKNFAWCREVSMWIYLLHPLMLIFIRGGLGVIEKLGASGIKTWVLSYNGIFYLLVCSTTFAVSFLLWMGKEKLRGRRGVRDGKKPGMD